MNGAFISPVNEVLLGCFAVSSGPPVIEPRGCFSMPMARCFLCLSPLIFPAVISLWARRTD